MEHDPLCEYEKSWRCDCIVIGEARRDMLRWPRVREVYERGYRRGLRDAVAAVQAITDDPEAAAWYERFYEDPDDPEKITVMVELDRVVDAIEGLAAGESGKVGDEFTPTVWHPEAQPGELDDLYSGRKP